MKKLAATLAVCVALSSLGAPAAEARHRHRHHDSTSIGEVLATIAIAGLVIAAVGDGSNDYAGAPWGVIDTEVSPKDAQVFIDGGYVGQAKSFDGWPGYLPLEPGTYRLEFREEGFAPYRIQARVLPGRRLVIKKRLRPLAAGELPPPPMQGPSDRRQGPPVERRQGPPPSTRQPAPRDNEDWRWKEPEGRKQEQPAPRPIPPEAQGPPPSTERQQPNTSEPAPQPETGTETASEMSELKLEVNPDDASVYLDGQFYINAKDLEGGARGILLAPGEYKLEVVRPGYKTQSFTVVLGSEARTLKVQMEKQ